MARQRRRVSRRRDVQLVAPRPRRSDARERRGHAARARRRAARRRAARRAHEFGRGDRRARRRRTGERGATRARPSELIGAYKRSKYEAEQVAQRAVAGGQDVVIVNPTTPVGPWDAKPTPTGEIIVRFCTGRMPAYMDTGLNFVDVRDVAAGHIAAYERGRTGERYILGNENMHAARAARPLGRAHRRGRRRRSASRRSFRWPTRRPGSSCWSRWGSGPTSPSRPFAWPSSECTTTSRKRTAILGFTPAPVTRALSDAVTWFRRTRLPDHAHIREK